MEAFEFEVCLRVKVEAFSKEDAKEVLDDTFGVGEDGGLEIKSITIKE